MPTTLTPSQTIPAIPDGRFIPLASPDIREEDIRQVVDVLQSGMLIQGPQVEALEAAFAKATDTAHAIAVSNGTATMHLVLKALGIGPGDEVIVPAFSYVATANVVELVGATPVFIDIDLATFNIDVARIEERITPRTKAIIPVHEFGLACDIEAVMTVAMRHGLAVLEDAACALGGTQNGRSVGSFGIAGSFSLHPRKSITCGEGGVITTNDAALARKLRQLRNHGIESTGGQMVFEEAGFNYRMTDFQAALASSQMTRLPQTLEKKTALGNIYRQAINTPRVVLPSVPQDRNHTWQTFHLLLNTPLEQATVIQKLKSEGIGTNYGAQCIPAQRYYQQKYGENAADLYPNAYRAYATGLAVPLYEKLGIEDIHRISTLINAL